MKKFLLSIFCCLVAFVSVKAEEYTYIFESKQFTENGKKELNGVSWTLTGNAKPSNYNSTKGQQFGTSSAPYSSMTLSTSDIEGTITKIVINTSGANKINAQLNVSVGNTDFGQTVNLSSTATDYTFNGNASGEIKFTYTQSSSVAIYIKSITITYTTNEGGEGGGENPEPEQPVTPVAPTLPASCNFDNAMTVEITNIADGATAYYSLNNDTDWTDGTSVTISETTTVYAKVVKDELSSEVVSATYTKNEPVTPPAEGEVVDVLNRELTGVSGTTYTSWSNKTATSSAVYAGNSAGGNYAIQLRSNNSNSGIVTTQSGGKAKKIVVEWNNSKTESGRTLDVYGKNTAYSAATDLYSASTQGTKIGSIICGTSTELTINDNYEYIGLRSNSNTMYLTSVSITWDASAGVTPVAPNTPVLTESQTFKGSMMVTITSNATVYYTTDGTTPSKTNGTEYTVPFEITATTTVKAVAVNEVGESEVAEATYTLFVVEETEGYYVKVASEPADWSGKYLVVYEEGADAYVFNGKDEANGYVTASIDDAIIKANSEVDAVAVTIAAMEGGYSVKTANGYIYGASGSNKLNTNASEPQLNTIKFTADGVNIEAERYLRFNSDKGDMRFRYYNLTSGKPVQLYKYVTELPSYQLTVTNAGYATLFLDFNAAIPAEVEAYTVTKVNDGYVTLTEVTGVLPANTGVIVKASEGNYTFAYSKETPATVTENLLEGTVADKNIEGEAYVLGIVDGEVGLYKAEKAGGVWLNNANKAYLPIASGAALSASLRFDFGGTTAIEEVETEVAETVIYDLSGRRVNEITKAGVYVVGGRKILVK